MTMNLTKNIKNTKSEEVVQPNPQSNLQSQPVKKKDFKKKDNRSKKKSFQKTAQTRINELFDEAEKLFELKPEYANNCVELARKISLRYKVPFSKEQKLRFCKNCKSYLLPSKTSRLRVSEGKIKVLCLKCKHIHRYRYK
jgi:ribonuclease P protein subunit RPR2